MEFLQIFGQDKGLAAFELHWHCASVTTVLQVHHQELMVLLRIMGIAGNQV